MSRIHAHVIVAEVLGDRYLRLIADSMAEQLTSMRPVAA
jgi:hypothetical protein